MKDRAPALSLELGKPGLWDGEEIFDLSLECRAAPLELAHASLDALKLLLQGSLLRFEVGMPVRATDEEPANSNRNFDRPHH